MFGPYYCYFFFFLIQPFPEPGSNPQDAHAQSRIKAPPGLSCRFSDSSRSSCKNADSPGSLDPPATHQRQVPTSKRRKLFPWQPPSHHFMLAPRAGTWQKGREGSGCRDRVQVMTILFSTGGFYLTWDTTLLGFGMCCKGLTGLGCLSQTLTAQKKLPRDVVTRLREVLPA